MLRVFDVIIRNIFLSFCMCSRCMAAVLRRFVVGFVDEHETSRISILSHTACEI